MKVVIIGCTHAGVAAVTEILKNHPDTEVTVYERNDNVSFLSCGIPLYLSHKVDKLEDMFYSSPEQLSEMGATVRLRHDVLKVDSEAKKIVCENLETYEIFTDTYDKLVMATGSYVIVPPLVGIDDSRVLLCKNYEQAQAIYKSAQTHKRITIVGGGYVGVELADSYSSTNHEVTLIQSSDQVLNNYIDPIMSDEVAKLLGDHGVNVILDERVTGFEGDDEADKVDIETDHRTIEADLVIVCTGFMANTELVQGQVEMDRRGALLVNDYLQTSDPDIYAAGDACVSHFNPEDTESYIPLATNAVRQGTLAGLNIFGNIQKKMGTQATSAIKIFGYTMASSGLTLRNAKNAGIDADAVLFDDDYRYDFMPEPQNIKIMLVYDKTTRRIIGTQLFSKYDVSQSANTISVCIQNKNTIDDLAYVDMLFNPHYDKAYNYLNLVAQMAIEKERANAES